ncbi:MAG: thrombospondin type 3 repeat-containing protein [bacterium]
MDNAPFDTNPDQSDLNGDGIGDKNTIPFVVQKDQKDTDGDGVPDDTDLCPYIHGMGSSSGCPDINQSCADQQQEGPIMAVECNRCPCQYTDFTQNLSNGDSVKAILRDKEKITLYNYSLPRIVNF